MIKATKQYQLVKVEALRDSRGDVYDWAWTIVATGNTVKGLFQYARMKGLNFDTHDIEELTIEDSRTIDEIRLGSLTDLVK